MNLERRRFGTTPGGTNVDLFTLVNDGGTEARIATLGATLTALRTPDRDGRPGDVALGFDALEPYLGSHPHFGSTAGRVANRIGGARFALEGRQYALRANAGRNHLHGGPGGFHAAVWEAAEVSGDGEVGVRLSRTSPDGEEGYPGNLLAVVTYTLTNEDELRIDFRATADRTTVVNLTHHSYFNLRDGGASGVLEHELELAASHYTPVDAESIPTGEIAPVAGTPLDFRTPTAIGARIDALGGDPGGYDHNYALDPSDAVPRFAARVREPRSGRVMEVWTTQPGIQLYTGNYLDGSFVGRGGVPYRKRCGLCLETQHFPDAPNQPRFPPIILRAGERYAHRASYRFRAE
jgi:aldose 1-epimerase